MSELNEQMLERIDNYLTGNLSPIESTQFESEVASSPQLQEEVNFQSDIVNSIKEYRRFELKSRLNKIEVSSKSRWMSKGILGGIAATAVITTLGIFSYEYTKFDNNPTLIAQDQGVVKFEEKTTQINDETLPEIEITEVAVENNTNENVVVENKEPDNVGLTDISVPDLTINEDEEGDVSNNSLATIEDLESVDIISSGAANVAVEFKKGKKLAYKFYDQKLFLFGKFNEAAPYEVIEIKTHYGKEFYLKFDDDYYVIKKGIVEKTPLHQIENKMLIKKLNNLD